MLGKDGNDGKDGGRQLVAADGPLVAPLCTTRAIFAQPSPRRVELYVSISVPVPRKRV